jgi:hypothetical protein
MQKILVVIGLIFVCTNISAQPRTKPAEKPNTLELFCDDTTKIAKLLVDQYKEVPIVIGSTDNTYGNIMTFWTNPDTKTWTILVTKKDKSCVLDAGGKFEIVGKKTTQISLQIQDNVL